MTALVEVTAPTTYPITVADAKEHLRIGGTAEDALLTAYIAAATAEAQVWCNRQFVTATYDWFLDGFPAGGCAFRVPRAPLQSVTTLKYTDENGTQQTWTSTNYTVDTNTAPARIVEAWDVAWPSIRDVPNAVEIRIVTGYGAIGSVPNAVKHALKMMVGAMYEDRESQQLTTFSFQRNPVVVNLLSTERLMEFH